VSTRRRLPVIAVAASLAIAMPLLLSGCSLLHLPGSDDKGGGITIPGVGSVGSGKLPGDYPTKDVPVIDGKIIAGASIGSGDDHAWNITIKATSLDDFDKIAKLLTDAGFTADPDATTTGDDTRTGLFTTDTYNVVVAVTKGDSDNPFLANYTVTKAKKQ
jgi:hypothetical protein